MMTVPTVKSSCSISAATPGTTVAGAGDAGGNTSAVLRSARDGAPIARAAGGTTAAGAAEATAGGPANSDGAAEATLVAIIGPAIIGPGPAGTGGTNAAAAAGEVGGTAA